MSNRSIKESPISVYKLLRSLENAYSRQALELEQAKIQIDLLHKEILLLKDKNV